MQTMLHPEVLANDWVPPVALARSRAVAELVRRLDPPRPEAPPPWIAAVAGPGGSGTSTVARIAAREVADRVRVALAGPAPRILSVRTVSCRGTHGVASGLLRRLDEGFDGRGFPVAEILAGFLRRLRREGRPAVLLLDDVGVGGPDLAPVLRAVSEPDRFLPEGETGLPPIWVLLAGTSDSLGSLERSLGRRVSLGPVLELPPYSQRELEAIVQDRVFRVAGPAASAEVVQEIVHRTVRDGGGSARALDLLRRRFLGVPFRSTIGFGEPRALGVAIEPRVLRALDVAMHDRSAPVGEVRRVEAELARAGGDRPLPATTLWRRIVQLERAGYLRREIRTGGSGGTQSIVRLLAPVDEWVTVPSRPGSPRDDAGRGLDATPVPTEEVLGMGRNDWFGPGPDDRAD